MPLRPLAHLPLICWESRHLAENRGDKAKTSFDCTDAPINEPSPFDRKWYSHKFKGPGLQYEIGVFIANGHIVCVNGAYSCGLWSDIAIARDCLLLELLPDERVLADGGYTGEERIWAKGNSGYQNVTSIMEGTARARHETVKTACLKFLVS